jgi:phosphate transport system substrate-binding protein
LATTVKRWWCLASGFLVLMSGLCPLVSAQNSVMLVATGSSLPEPLYLLWNEEYHRAHAETQLRYLPEGTSESATRILAGAGDLGGGDAPIPEKQLKEAARPVVELPSVLIGIAIVYNVPGAPNLRLSGPALANIYLGKTTSWSDPEIAKLNPDLHLPALPIKVIHRTDGKGSSYIFSDYLAKVSPEFLAKAGRSVSPKWPVGAALNRTEDLLDNVRKTQGAIGYTELNWAEKSALPVARIKNAAGEFVKPSTASIADAASALASKMSEDFRVSLVNAPGKGSYPIASFTWLYVPAHAQDPTRGQSVSDYLKWVYSAGQELARDHGYAPLPPAVLDKVRAKAATLR